jgi:hypothetical protein
VPHPEQSEGWEPHIITSHTKSSSRPKPIANTIGAVRDLLFLKPPTMLNQSDHKLVILNVTEGWSEGPAASSFQDRREAPRNLFEYREFLIHVLTRPHGK